MKVYTVKEVAELLHLTTTTIRKYVREGSMDSVNKPGKILITEKMLQKYLEGGISND